MWESIISALDSGLGAAVWILALSLSALIVVGAVKKFLFN